MVTRLTDSELLLATAKNRSPVQGAELWYRLPDGDTPGIAWNTPNMTTPRWKNPIVDWNHRTVSAVRRGRANQLSGTGIYLDEENDKGYIYVSAPPTRGYAGFAYFSLLGYNAVPTEPVGMTAGIIQQQKKEEDQSLYHVVAASSWFGAQAVGSFNAITVSGQGMFYVPPGQTHRFHLGHDNLTIAGLNVWSGDGTEVWNRFGAVIF